MFNKAELARRYDCNPRTIDRCLKIQSGELELAPSTRQYHSKLDDYKNTIINKVDTYGCTATAAYKFITKKGYTGKYSIVADLVMNHKEQEIKKATIRFETNPGHQAQVDWKEDMTLANRKGEIFKINIFLMITSDRYQEVYNEEFDTWTNLVTLSQNFMDDINHEISQASGEIALELFSKEKEYLLTSPRVELLTSYISRQEDKTYPVNKESMIKYEG